MIAVEYAYKYSVKMPVYRIFRKNILHPKALNCICLLTRNRAETRAGLA